MRDRLIRIKNYAFIFYAIHISLSTNKDNVKHKISFNFIH